jgi:putative phosphoesterase
MKIAVIADTHITSGVVPPGLLRIAGQADMVIHAGDLVQAAVLKELKSVCPDVRAVYGNMDGEELKAKLSARLIIDLPGGIRIGVMHGWGAPAGLLDIVESEFRGKNVQIAVYGHSHQPSRVERNGVIYFNPGSPTDKVYAPYNSYGLIEIRNGVEAKIVRI